MWDPGGGRDEGDERAVSQYVPEQSLLKLRAARIGGDELLFFRRPT